METDAVFWDSLVFDGIDDVGTEAVTAAFCPVPYRSRSGPSGLAGRGPRKPFSAALRTDGQTVWFTGHGPGERW
ncbi:hypothetical protein [Streptomyces sp. NPDC058751]|uniref:hypothetical protein n=1 Tax=Streptomyces sp. NPDC058751 TaxID=3346623 RepID=UPI0036B00365